MTPNWKHLFKLCSLLLLLLLTCEYLIYYIVIATCSWPRLVRDGSEHSLRVMFLSDTHLLGSRDGHWFDKLRREWQMERSFQSAVTLLNPDAVFVLGDLTDEGQWASDEEFQETVKRFRKMFRIGDSVPTHVVVGNHDVGFHYRINPHLVGRFQKEFGLSSVDIINIKDILFVSVNSIAMENDHCPMCTDASNRLKEISQRLNCSRFGTATGRKGGEKLCLNYEKLPNVAPILLQHFPLFRISDAECIGIDSAPLDQKYKIFKPKLDVISKESSSMLLSFIQPRLVLSGHIHHSCYVVHESKTPEISVPSFSWRNRDNPSFIMVTLTREDYSFSKCFLPKESTVISIYIFGGVMIVIWVTSTRRIFFMRQHTKYKE